MTADLTHLVFLLAAIPVVAAIALFFYWLGHRHGRLSVTGRFVAAAPPAASHAPLSKLAPGAPAAKSPEIPSYRVHELATLLDLGILTQEEFDAEKGKLHAGRPA